MKIVVTGGAGFIGSHVVDAYAAEGHEVAVIDNLSAGRKENLHKRVRLYSMDILDPAIPGLLGEIRPDVVNHHAAQMDLRRSVRDPLYDARVNVLGAIHLFEACRAAGVKKVIYASSGGAVYGEQDCFPAPEEHLTRPVSPYGISKLTAEHYLVYYEKVFGIPYVALRYSNVYGPRQTSMGEAGVVAIFARQLFERRSPTINGDGLQTRDYVYVGDVVRANVLALKTAFSGPLNIGTGSETDVVTLFAMMAELVGSKAPVVHGPPKAGEQRRSSLNCARAAGVLGWSPEVPLRRGLEQTVSYYGQATRQ